MKQASFKTNTNDQKVISKIAHRAVAMAAQHEVPYDLLSATMDLTACVANGCPLYLSELLESNDFNFAHDVFGIRRHINRTSGQLENCFVPRFAVSNRTTHAAA